MKNNILKFSLPVIFFLTYTLPVLAQDGEPGTPPAEDDPQTPLDNWQMLLVMVALIVGIYFLTRRKKQTA